MMVKRMALILRKMRMMSCRQALSRWRLLVPHRIPILSNRMMIVILHNLNEFHHMAKK